MRVELISEKLLNVNMTFGMALTLRQITDRMEQSTKQADIIRKVELGRAISTDEYELSISMRA